MNELRYFAGISKDVDAKTIIDNWTELGLSAMSRDYGASGLVAKFSYDAAAYNQKNDETRKAVLSFCGAKAGISDISETRHILNAFDNPTFESMYNAIFTEALLGIMVKTDYQAMNVFANIDTVDVGNSLTYEIETKGLPIAQRNSYMSNVTFLDGVAKTAITVTPKVYSTGTAIDVIRMLKGDIDMGKEIARVAMSLLYAQYKLCVGLVANTNIIANTPLYRTGTFNANQYVLTISYLQALNNAGVKAYGTLPALNKLGATATTSYGFASQDEVLRLGFLSVAYGIPHVILNQATDGSAPLGDSDGAVNMLVPNDKIFLMPDVGDKPVKLVRENYIRVMNTPASVNSINRREYQYFMAFDAAIATQAHFGIQSV